MPDSVAAARAAFPRGLAQPPQGFRSSVDALLLADFVPALASPRFVDLGTGSGMAACALALRLPEAWGTGIDINADAIDAAKRNAEALGLAERLHMAVADITQLSPLSVLFPRPCDVVMANPPYREHGTGRVSPLKARQAALCAAPGTLDAFCAAAYALLRHHGHFCLVFTASRLGDALESMRRHRLGPRRLRCVHTRPDRAAKLVLLEGRKDCAEDLVIEPPLGL